RPVDSRKHKTNQRTPDAGRLSINPGIAIALPRPSCARVSALLHHVNIDLGSVGLLELRSHFRFQFPRIDSRPDGEDEEHLALVLVELKAVQSVVTRDKQRLHRAKNRLRIDVVLESNPD